MTSLSSCREVSPAKQALHRANDQRTRSFPMMRLVTLPICYFAAQ